MARPGRLTALARFLEEAALGALYPVGRCIEPGVFAARRAFRLLLHFWRPAGVAALGTLVWTLAIPEPEPTPVPIDDVARVSAGKLARALVIEGRRDWYEDASRRRPEQSQPARSPRPEPEPYLACEQRRGMSSWAQRRRCPRKVEATLRPGEAICLCVYGAVFGIAPGSLLHETDVILETVPVSKTDWVVDEIFAALNDEKPLSKKYVLRSSDELRLKSWATLRVDLPRTTAPKVWGAIWEGSGRRGCLVGSHPWSMHAWDHDEAANMLGFGFHVLPRDGSAVVMGSN